MWKMKSCKLQQFIMPVERSLKELLVLPKTLQFFLAVYLYLSIKWLSSMTKSTLKKFESSMTTDSDTAGYRSNWFWSDLQCGGVLRQSVAQIPLRTGW